jgi:hypothetical protein
MAMPLGEVTTTLKEATTALKETIMEWLVMEMEFGDHITELLVIEMVSMETLTEYSEMEI